MLRTLYLLGLCVTLTGCAQAKQAAGSVTPSNLVPDGVERAVDSAGIRQRLRPDTTGTLAVPATRF